jgi:hypothetical protein
LKDVAFCSDSFGSEAAAPYGERSLSCLLWALIFANSGYLLDHPDTPNLYDAGIRWEAEKPQGRTACPEGEGQELFLGVRQVLEQGYADCEDVACWRISELRCGRGNYLRGPVMRPSAGHPQPTIIPVPWGGLRPIGPRVLPAFFKREIQPGSWLYHIVVFWPGLGYEDPSRVLGMGGAHRYG